MPDTPHTSDGLPGQLVKALQRIDGCPHMRPVHAIGCGAKGVFVPSPVAPDYCSAAHFRSDAPPTTVTVRFSNGSGCKDPHDGWSDVRGMAVRFTQEGQAPHDLVAMTLPCFFSPTPREFLKFAGAASPAPYTRESAWNKFKDMLALRQPLRDPYKGETISPDMGAIDFAGTHPAALPGVFGAAAIGAPASYVRAAYHAVHTFVVSNGKGQKLWVRFHWQPVLGVLNRPPLPTPPNEYLARELQQRLENEDRPEFILSMTIGETGDALNDPSRPWPPHRRRVTMGTLTLTDMLPPDQTEALGFNPCAVPQGIGLSHDPVLHIRREVYRLSAESRGHPWMMDAEAAPAATPAKETPHG